MSEKKVPKVRFKGFSGEWGECAFIDFIERKSMVSNEIGLPRVEYEDMIPEYGKLNKDIYKKKSEKTGVLFESGDILFGKLRPYLKNWLISDFRGIAVGDFWVLKPTEAVGYFVYYLIQNSRFQYVSNLSSGTKMPRSDWNVVSKSTFKIAVNRQEQAQISEFFKNLDNLIAQNQKKYDKLVNMKKACLDKMFPKEGADTPEVRFQGFSGEWEKKTFEQVAKYKNGKAHENDIVDNGKYIVVNSKFVSTDGIVKKYTNLQIEPLKKYDIAFVLSDVPNGRAIAKTFLINEDDKYSLNQRIACITAFENIYPYFLHLLLNRNKYFLLFDDGVKQTNLSLQDVYNFVSYYPIDINEQTKIGNFFQNIDTLITLQKTKLEKLKNIKKACLDKMFI